VCQALSNELVDEPAQLGFYIPVELESMQGELDFSVLAKTWRFTDKSLLSAE
jgi:hypothetical protein